MLNKIAFIYSESDNQQDLFTPYHTRFDCAIQYGTNCEPYKFDYQCNTAHTMPNIKDVMYSLLLDAWAYDDAENVFEFAEELGYDITDDYDKITKMYDACRNTRNALHRMFTDAELEVLDEETRD